MTESDSNRVPTTIIDYDDEEIASEILLDGVYSSKITEIFVEGECDWKFFSRFFNRDLTNIRYERDDKGGKKFVINSVKKFKNQCKCFGIIDADCDYINKKTQIESIFLTDFRDLDTMLISSRALKKLLIEHGSEKKVKILEIKSGKKILDILLDLTKEVGLLYCYNEKNNLGLRLKNINIEKYFDFVKLKFDFHEYLSVVRDKTVDFHPEKKIDIDKIEREIESDVKKIKDLRYICRGHDLSELLCIFFSNLIGSDSCGFPRRRNQVEKDFRLSFEETWFRETQLFNKIQKWEESNPPYKVLL